MGRERDGQARRARAGVVAAMGLLMMAGALGGCSGGSSLNMDNINKSLFGASSSNSGSAAGVNNAEVAAANNDTPCPDVKVRTGAATLMIGSKPGEGEPSPLDVRYQGSIVRTARECHLNAGLLTIKVGVEGRIITGPAGGPGTVNVPLRIAVVHETLNPTTVATKFTLIPVTVNSEVDRVTFTHVEPDLTFPLPRSASDIDSYVIYVGFDPLSAHPPKKPARRHKRAKRPRR